jgi:hypothetical protein
LDRADSRQEETARGFARLSEVEAQLAACVLSPTDREATARLHADTAAALVLLLSRDDGCIGRAELAAAASRLTLALPTSVMARLPAIARLAALDLATLAASAADQLGLAQAEDRAMAKNEKPRRRQARPRLEIVVP